MSKNNSKIQKLICYAFLVATAGMILVAFIYANRDWVNLLVSDDTSNFYVVLGKQIEYAGQYAYKDQGKSYFFVAKYENCYSYVFSTAETAEAYYIQLWKNIQIANNALFFTGVATIVCLVVSAVGGHFTNRKYRLSNLIFGLTTAVVGLGFSVYSILTSSALVGQIDKIKMDITIYNEAVYASNAPSVVSSKIVNLSENGAYLGVVAGIVYIVFCAGFAAWTVYKYLLSQKQMRMEALLND